MSILFQRQRQKTRIVIAEEVSTTQVRGLITRISALGTVQVSGSVRLEAGINRPVLPPNQRLPNTTRFSGPPWSGSVATREHFCDNVIALGKFGGPRVSGHEGVLEVDLPSGVFFETNLKNPSRLTVIRCPQGSGDIKVNVPARHRGPVKTIVDLR